MEIKNFKDSAARASSYLQEHGIAVPHTRLLEALSVALGERNWSTLRSQLEKLHTKGQHADTAAVEQPIAAPEWRPANGVPMTQAQFVNFGGNKCPYCGSTELTASGLEADGDQVWDETECDSCGASWTTTYGVNGYTRATEGSASATKAGSARDYVVDSLVEDVQQRAAQHGFSFSGRSQALRLARSSDEVLDLQATEEELMAATQKLAG
jgi:hypothetical protein